MSIEKPKLFIEQRDFILFVILMTLVIMVRLFMMHGSYVNFISKPFYYTNAVVLNSYQKYKDGRSYTVLKLHSDDDLTFFTTSNKTIDMQNTELRLMIYPSENISFREYLGYFYVKSRIKNIRKVTNQKTKYMDMVLKQHEDRGIGAFYNAIFFASTIPRGLREKISLLGVSHLVALSGFHIGILWGVIYGFLLFLYKPFQAKYWPYRYSLIDVGTVSMFMLGVYVWFVGAPPSLMRSYLMLVIGWGIVISGMELISFVFLTTTMLILLTMMPSLVVSISFWLSVIGVFYIFLLLKYSENYHKSIISLFVIPVGIFILMLPIVHAIFGTTSLYQLLSPLLSILFIPFYPLSIIMHLIGAGAMMDSVLLWLFDLPKIGIDNILPFWAATVYVILSILSIWSRWLFYAIVLFAISYGMYII